jgi:hypothetical protein
MLPKRKTEPARKTEHHRQTQGKTAKKRRSLWTLLVIAITVVALIAGSSLVWAYNYNNTKDLSWYLGKESAAEFTISTAGQLHAFSALVNGDAEDATGSKLAAADFAGKTVKLANGLSLWDKEFTPIGTDEHPFAGTFDGQGYVLSKFKITTPKYGLSNVGLFGYTSTTAMITGLSLTENNNIILQSSDPTVAFNNIGTIVGNNNGTISNCSSAAYLSITHTATGDADAPLKAPVATNIGGVIGASSGVVSGIHRSGKLEFVTPANAFTDPNNSEKTISSVAEHIGGVIGSTTADISATTNAGTLYVITSGSAGKDRFGSAVDSKAVSVGGVVGSSTGNILNTSNSGSLFTSANPTEVGNPQASFDKLGKGDTVAAQSNGGADGIGGIVGTLRAAPLSGMDTSGKDDGMASGAPNLRVSDCTNTGFINGLHAVGGIVGAAGTNTTITRCVNGVAGDLQLGHVRSTRWNKAATGGIAGQSFGIVSYSRNHAQVENTKTGYYTAGIVGMALKYDAQPQRSEIFACYNTGNIFCGGVSASFREGGIVGSNDAYVHDNTFLFGTVSTHIAGGSDAQKLAKSLAVGADFGVVQNTTVAYETQKAALDAKGVWIKSGEAVAILNTLAPVNDWNSYYFISKNVNNGYPILNGEAPSDGALDLSVLATTITLQKHAPYTAAYNPMPTLKVSVVIDGKTVELINGADFRVIADPTALNDETGVCKGITDGEAKYQAGIMGIGDYTGSPSTKVAYGISKGVFSECTVVAANAPWTGDNQNKPDVVVLDASGAIVPATDYDVVVNGDEPCYDRKAYPVEAIAKPTSNYEGVAQGTYNIVNVSLYSDCDTVGIYLEDFYQDGKYVDNAVWYFDEEKSDIYQVIPELDANGDLQWIDDKESDYYGLIQVKGMEKYQTDDGRELMRATPHPDHVDEQGAPIYGDMQVDFTGTNIQPKPIAVLHNGRLLEGISSDKLTSANRDSIDYAWAYARFGDNSMRPGGANINATTNAEQPEASVVVYGNADKCYSNYVYIDFKIQPIDITADKLKIKQLKTDMNYASGGRPKTPAHTLDVSRRLWNSYFELRYAPDPDAYVENDPATYYPLDASNWSLVFDHAVAPGGADLDSDGTGYVADSQLYYRVEPTQSASLRSWGSILTAPCKIIDNGSGATATKTLLSDEIIEVRFTQPAAAYDTTVRFTANIWPQPCLPAFELYDTVLEKTLIPGASGATANADFYISTTVGGYKPPVLNPETGKLEGTFVVSSNSQSAGYTNSRTISYSYDPPPFPEQGEGLFKDSATVWMYSRTTNGIDPDLPWRTNGWSAEQISEQLVLGFLQNGKTKRFEDGFTVEAITTPDGKPVRRITELDRPYNLTVSYNPAHSLWFKREVEQDALTATYTIPVRMAMFNNMTSSAIQTQAGYGKFVFRSIQLAQTEYMYTGHNIIPELAARDGNGDLIDPSYFVPIIRSDAATSHGNTKGVGEYNVPVKSGNLNIYEDLNFTGDGIHYSQNLIPDESSRKIQHEIGTDKAVPINLRFSVVPADISDPEKVRIEVDEAFYHAGEQSRPKISFYAAADDTALNYVEGETADYSLSYRNNTEAGEGIIRITVNSENLVTNKQDENDDYYMELPFVIHGSARTTDDVTWNYASSLTVRADTTVESGVLGTYKDTDTAVSQDAYTVAVGTLSSDVFTVQSTGWSAGDSAWLCVTGIKEGILTGETILGPISVVAPDATNTFGAGGFEPTVTIAPTPFTGAAVSPQVTVKDGGDDLLLGRDFRLSCLSVDAGDDAVVTVQGIGAYAGSRDYAFTVTPVSMSELDVKVASQVFTGQRIVPNASAVTSVKLNGVSLDDDDWIVAIEDDAHGENINVASGGTLTLRPGASPNLTGSIGATFAITPKSLDDSFTIADLQPQPYQGVPVKLDGSAFVLTDTQRAYTMSYGSDYVVSGYANNLNVGTATVFITGMGNYASTDVISTNFTIEPAILDSSMISNIFTSYEYNGSSIRPVPVLTLGEVQLGSSDYRVEYADNNQIGVKTGSLTIVPTGGSLKGSSQSYVFDIIANVSTAQIEAIPNGSYVRGGTYQPDVLVAFGGAELVEGKHYNLTYDNNNAGIKTLHLEAIAPCIGSRVVSYEIDGKPLTQAMITKTIADQTFTGSRIDPELEIKDGDYTLVEGTDYNVEGALSVSDTAKALIVGKGNYAGLLSQSFKIKPRTWTPDDVAQMLQSEGAVSIKAKGLWRAQGAIETELTVYDKARDSNGNARPQSGTLAVQDMAYGSLETDKGFYKLLLGKDFTATYSNNDGVGEATVTLTGIGSYDFTLSHPYTIKGDIKAARVAHIDPQTWTGKAVTPLPVVTLGDKTLVADTDYVVTYSANTDAGTATLNITGLGLYEGNTDAAFNIIKASVPTTDKNTDTNTNTNATTTASHTNTTTTTNNYYNNSGGTGGTATPAATATALPAKPADATASPAEPAETVEAGREATAVAPTADSAASRSLDEEKTPLAAEVATTAPDITLITILAIVAALIMALLVGVAARLYLNNKRLTERLGFLDEKGGSL